MTLQEDFDSGVFDIIFSVENCPPCLAAKEVKMSASELGKCFNNFFYGSENKMFTFRA